MRYRRLMPAKLGPHFTRVHVCDLQPMPPIKHPRATTRLCCPYDGGGSRRSLSMSGTKTLPFTQVRTYSRNSLESSVPTRFVPPWRSFLPFSFAQMTVPHRVLPHW